MPYEALTNFSRTPHEPPKGLVRGLASLLEETETPLGGAPKGGGVMEEKEQDVLASHSPSVGDKPEEAREESTTSDGGESSLGGDITKKQNSYKVAAEDGDRGCVEVGHAGIVEKICEQAAIYYYHPTEEQREQLMQLTIRQLEVVSQRFQQQMSQRLTYPNRAKTQLSFEFALGLAKRSAPV